MYVDILLSSTELKTGLEQQNNTSIKYKKVQSTSVNWTFFMLFNLNINPTFYDRRH